MKRTLIAALLAGAALSAHAEEKLKIIDLSDANSSKPSQAAKVTATATASEAKDFIARLNAAVEKGHSQVRSGKIDSVQLRKQAQSLAALQTEGEKFGVLFTPFHKCNEAAISASSSWQGLIGNNQSQFENGFNSYNKERDACIQAAR
jgi:hypothetical protein